MSSKSVAAVINYVKVNREFFGFPAEQKITFSDCTKLFRISKLNTHELQIFDGTVSRAEVFLPAWVEDLSLKEAIRKLKDVKYEDFFVSGFLGKQPDVWKFMSVTPNRIVMLDTIIKNGSTQVADKSVELAEAQKKIKELEEKLAKYNSTAERTICNYMTIKNGVATIHSDSLDCKSALHVFTDTYAEREQVKIEDVIENYQQLAAVHNDIAANLKRAKFDGANYVQCKP